MSTKKQQTHYQILGVETNVGDAEIKRAYRRLVKHMHPDIGHSEQDAADRKAATERMMGINAAYETLMDSRKRSTYDITIGLARSRRLFSAVSQGADEDEARQRYLRLIFLPVRIAIMRVLNGYQSQLKQLALDIYDEELVSSFESYVDSYEDALSNGSRTFTAEKCPQSLYAAVQMMRYCIAQAADAAEEMRRFCMNFDYDHLSLAGQLVVIAQDLCRQALKLSRY